MTLTNIKTTTDRVETLAKLYLNSQPADISSEIIAYNFTARRVPSLDIQKILYSEVVLRTAAYLQLGRAADPKVVFL